MSFQTLIDDIVGVVKSTQNVILQSYEIKTITGFLRKLRAVESAITEPFSDDQWNTCLSRRGNS